MNNLIVNPDLFLADLMARELAGTPMRGVSGFRTSFMRTRNGDLPGMCLPCLTAKHTECASESCSCICLDLPK